MSKKDYELTDKIFTASNVITAIRILLIPVCLYYMLVPYYIEYEGEIVGPVYNYIGAFLIFIIASASDGLDG